MRTFGISGGSMRGGSILNRHPEANAVTCCALEKINLREQGKAYMYDLRPIFEVYFGAM